jgi:hypothetical protein
MNLVYPLTNQKDYTELLFSLRSVEKFITPPYEIIIVGSQTPDWITDVTQIFLPDIENNKLISVRRKILAALEYLKEDIFFMNDDFMLLRPTDPKTFPYYSSGRMDRMAETGAKPSVEQLKKLGKTTRYSGHYPCIIRQDFGSIVEKFSDNIINKSVYCNMIDIPLIETPDCKLNDSTNTAAVKEFIKHRFCLSTGVYSLAKAIPVLNEMFPNASKFEI